MSTERERWAALIERLLVAVSHDLRGPLTTIQGFSELIRDEPLEPSQMKEFADDIHREAQRLDQLIATVVARFRGELAALEEG